MLKRLFSKQAKPSTGAGNYNSALGHVSEPIRAIVENCERLNARVSLAEDGGLILQITPIGGEPIRFRSSLEECLTVINCIIGGRVGQVFPDDLRIMNADVDLKQKFITLLRRKARTNKCRVFCTMKKGNNLELKIKGRNGYVRFCYKDEYSCTAEDFKL